MVGSKKKIPGGEGPGSKPDPTAREAPDTLSLRRLERLADFIFAISFLLLLVTIELASAEASTAREAYAYLWKNVTQNFGFVISFLVIAYYWMSHQQYFAHYASTNKVHTVIELIYLMTIAGMPFNNHFISVFPSELAPRLAISCDIFFAGILAFASWVYATSGNRLVDPGEIAPELVTRLRQEALVMPALALVAAGAAMLHPFAWDLVLFIGPILAIGFLQRRRKQAPSSP